jgi:hypothetical protein
VAAVMNGRRSQPPYFKAGVIYARNAEATKAWWAISTSPDRKDLRNFGTSCGRGNIGKPFGNGLAKDTHGRNGNRETHLKERTRFLNFGRKQGNHSIKGRPNHTEGSNNERGSPIILQMLRPDLSVSPEGARSVSSLGNNVPHVTRFSFSNSMLPINQLLCCYVGSHRGSIFSK